MNPKHLFIALIAFFVLLFLLRKPLQNIRYWFINKKLARALRKKNTKRLKLKHRLIIDLKKYLKLNGISEYIPYDHKSREKIRVYIQENFGEELKKLDIRYKITKQNGLRFL